MSLNIRKVKCSDLKPLVYLINTAYRTQTGRSWTSEKQWVQGKHITEKQLANELQQPYFELLVGMQDDEKIMACIGLTSYGHAVEIGTFAISPAVQNQGYGRQLLEYAEHDVKQYHPAIHTLVMYVLDVRTELLAYYQRCGYQLTGQVALYPLEANVGLPLIPIQLLEMKKDLSKQIP